MHHVLLFLLAYRFSAAWVPEDHYTMVKVKEFHSRKWGYTQSNYEIKTKPLPDEGWQNKLYQILESVLNTARSKAKSGSMR